MRNWIRMKNRRETGTFSGNPKRSSGYTITALHRSNVIEIDAVYQATDQQFSRWMQSQGVPVPDKSLSAFERLELLKELDLLAKND